jgi:hypothetical protein
VPIVDCSSFLACAVSKPPLSPPFVKTPVLCEYWPRRIDVRAGQHSVTLSN